MTSSMEAQMTEADWQARAKRRKRRVNLVVGTLFCIGLLSGLLIGYFEDEQAGLVAANSIPPWLAVVSAVLFLVATTLGSRKLMQVSDELERTIHIKTTVMAGNVVLIGYPVWFILWKGGIVPEPDALWMFLAGFGTSILTYAFYKLR
jgi:drug/metabolite transporter (DMT)-like permease